MSYFFWDITLCSPVKINRRFGGIYVQPWSSRSKTKPSKQDSAWWLLNAYFLFGLLFCPEDGNYIFFRNICWVSPDDRLFLIVLVRTSNPTICISFFSLPLFVFLSFFFHLTPFHLFIHALACLSRVLPPAERLNKQHRHRGLAMRHTWLPSGCKVCFAFVSLVWERCCLCGTNRDVWASCPEPLSRRDCYVNVPGPEIVWLMSKGRLSQWCNFTPNITVVGKHSYLTNWVSWGYIETSVFLESNNGKKRKLHSAVYSFWPAV
jgi:hypothetical protein